MIVFHNRQRKIALNLPALQDFAQRALPLVLRDRGRGQANFPEIHIIVVSDRRIAELHRRFMGIAGPTDVLTFQHGEIFLSVETARRQARRYRTSLNHELRLYLVHGLLHLAGFDDRAPSARRRMEQAQEKILAALL